MWIGVVQDELDYEMLKQAFPGTVGASRSETVTPSGSKLWAEAGEGGKIAFAWNPPGADAARNFVEWAHRNLPSNRYLVSTGRALSCGETPSTARPFLPAICLRSAGRTDTVASPVLYEEIPLDPTVQAALVLASGLSDEIREPLFSAEDLRTRPEFLEWIRRSLGCAGADAVTGEMLVYGRRFTEKVGCLKILGPAESAGEMLISAWRRLSLEVSAPAEN